MADIKSPASSESTSFVSLLTRLLWMLVGNVALAVCLLSILQNRESLFSSVDIVYAVTFPLMIAVRYVDITRYKGSMADGKPATLADWRRYSLTLAAGAVAAWLVAHGVAYALA